MQPAHVTFQGGKSDSAFSNSGFVSSAGASPRRCKIRIFSSFSLTLVQRQIPNMFPSQETDFTHVSMCRGSKFPLSRFPVTSHTNGCFSSTVSPVSPVSYPDGVISVGVTQLKTAVRRNVTALQPCVCACVRRCVN